MAFDISPQEFQMLTDRHQIMTIVPKDEITEEMVIKRLKNARMNVGDQVDLMCMSPQKDTVLFETTYRIYHLSEVMTRVEDNDYNHRQVVVTTVKIYQTSPWRATPAGELGVMSPAGDPGAEILLRREWDIKLRAHHVMQGDKIVHTTTDKELAERIVAGEPIPQKAA